MGNAAQVNAQTITVARELAPAGARSGPYTGDCGVPEEMQSPDVGLLRSPAGASSLATKRSIPTGQAPDLPGIIHTNPLAIAHSWHNPNTTRRSALSMRLQRVISSTVRWQPVQISSSSSAQMLTHGEATGRSTGFILAAQPSHAHSAARYAHSARRWLRACASAPRSAHAPPCPASPSPASHRGSLCLRQSANWRR